MASCIQEHCAGELPDEAKFCVWCGAPQECRCPNPRCGGTVRLGETLCPACGRFLRECPTCHKLFLLDRETCDNEAWGCEETPLADFHRSYAMAGVDATRCGGASEPPERELPQLEAEDARQTWWSYSEGGGISDVVTGHGRAFFVSCRDRCIRAIPEGTRSRGLGPKAVLVKSSDPLPFPANGVPRDLVMAEGLIAFLAGPPAEHRPRQPPVYRTANAYCLQADTFERRGPAGPLSGYFQTHLLAGDLWVLVRYDAARKASQLDAYSTLTGEQAFSHPLRGAAVEEQIPPVVANAGIFLATTDGSIYRIPLGGGPPQKLEWLDGGDRQTQIRAMAWGGGRLRVLACPADQPQAFGLYSFAEDSGGLQRSPVMMPAVPRQGLWILDHWVFLYDAEKRCLLAYDCGDELFLPGATCSFSAQDSVQALLPVRAGEALFLMARVTRQDGLTHLRAVQIEPKPMSVPLSRDLWREAGFAYSNKMLFAYDRQQGAIKGIRVIR